MPWLHLLSLNGEIHPGAKFSGDAGAEGTQAKVLDGDRLELLHHRFLQLLPERTDDLVAELGAGGIGDRILARLEIADDADDLAERDAAPLARQPIAATRAARAGEDAAAHELLQHLLEIAPRDALAFGDLARLHRYGAGVVGDVEHRLDGEEHLLGETDHLGAPRLIFPWSRSRRRR